MAVYHYDNGPVERVAFTSLNEGSSEADIIVRAGTPAENLAQMRANLSAKSITALPDVIDGKPALRVRGLTNEQQLMKALQKEGVGAYSDKTITDADRNRKRPSFSEKIHDKSLLLSALFYDLGNIAYVVSGLQRGKHNPSGKMTAHDKSEMMTGVAFSFGDVLMTIYGSKKGDERIQQAAGSLAQHLHEKGIEIPKGAALDPASLYHSGAMKETHNWMKRHIIHIKSLTEMSGGLLTVHAGMKRDSHGKLNQGKITSGILLSTGWLTTLLLDKSHKPPVLAADKPPANNLFDTIEDNPRGWVTRPLSIANNAANLWGALGPKNGERVRFREEFEEAKRAYAQNPTKINKAEMERHGAKQHDYAWNVLTQSSFIVAHSLFGMSGSDRPKETKGDKEMMKEMVLISANMLAEQPEQLRKAAVEETAEYIARQAHVSQGKEEIANTITTKINELSKTGWVERTASTAQGQNEVPQAAR